MLLKVRDIKISYKEMEEIYYAKRYRKNYFHCDSHGSDINIKKIILSAEMYT